MITEHLTDSVKNRAITERVLFEGKRVSIVRLLHCLLSALTRFIDFSIIEQIYPFCSSSVSVSDSPIKHYTKRVVLFACFWHEHLLSSLESQEEHERNKYIMER